MTIRSPRPSWLVAAAGLLALVGSIAAPITVAAPMTTQTAQAATAAPTTVQSAMNSTLLTEINSDRATLGLRALRLDNRLVGLAAERAVEMAATDQLAHVTEIGAAERSVGVAPFLAGEAIGETNTTCGVTSATYIYGLWRNSPEHWGLITSNVFNYIGIGVAYQQAGGQTFAALDFAEEADITPPISAFTSVRRSGTTVSFTWGASDPLLQTHTAGLRDFQVAYRVDGGTWRTLWSATKRLGITLANRPKGHTYSIEIRSRDWRNNVSAWVIRSVRVS